MRILLNILAFLLSLFGLAVALLIAWTFVTGTPTGLRAPHWLALSAGFGLLQFAAANPLTSRLIGLSRRWARALLVQVFAIAGVVGGVALAYTTTPLDAAHVPASLPSDAICDVSVARVHGYGREGSVNWVLARTASPIGLCAKNQPSDTTYSEFTNPPLIGWHVTWQNGELIPVQRAVIDISDFSVLYDINSQSETLEKRLIVGNIVSPEFVLTDAFYDQYIEPRDIVIRRRTGVTDAQFAAYVRAEKTRRFLNSRTFVRVNGGSRDNISNIARFGDAVFFTGKADLDGERGQAEAIQNDELIWRLSLGAFSEFNTEDVFAAGRADIEFWAYGPDDEEILLFTTSIDLTGGNDALAAAQDAYRKAFIPRIRF